MSRRSRALSAAYSTLDFSPVACVKPLVLGHGAWRGWRWCLRPCQASAEENPGPAGHRHGRGALQLPVVGGAGVGRPPGAGLAGAARLRHAMLCHYERAPCPRPVCGVLTLLPGAAGPRPAHSPTPRPRVLRPRCASALQANSYLVLRFVASNPGTWIFHCEGSIINTRGAWPAAAPVHTRNRASKQLGARNRWACSKPPAATASASSVVHPPRRQTCCCPCAPAGCFGLQATLTGI